MLAYSSATASALRRPRLENQSDTSLHMVKMAVAVTATSRTPKAPALTPSVSSDRSMPGPAWR